MVGVIFARGLPALVQFAIAEPAWAVLAVSGHEQQGRRYGSGRHCLTFSGYPRAYPSLPVCVRREEDARAGVGAVLEVLGTRSRMGFHLWSAERVRRREPGAIGAEVRCTRVLEARWAPS